MRMVTFAKRCMKEILRDPLNLAFGLAFPIVLLLLLSALQANIPVELFEISSLAPGITIFGLSFMTLFSSMLIAKDRESAFLQRLFTTPLEAKDFVLGYLISLLPIGLLQSIICYGVAAILGLPLSVNILYAVVANIPIAVFYISVGLLCGSLLSVKQVGGICGALFTNLSAWLSGIWFDVSLVGGVFVTIANALPFTHAVELTRVIISGNFSDVWVHLVFVTVYTVAFTVCAVIAFFRKMKNI